MLTRLLPVVILLGGLSHAQTAVWSQRSPAQAPVPSRDQTIAYDINRGTTVLYGANNRSETWEWDGLTWRMIGSTGPSGNHYHQMVYDTVRRRLVMVHMVSGTPPIQTWEWGEGRWVRATPRADPAPRSGFGLAFDEARGVTVMFGGLFSGEVSDTWEYDGTTWTQRSTGGPPGRSTFSTLR